MYKVIIDAGHGGRDPGALGVKSMEKDLNLKESKILKNILEEKGVEVILTREIDKYISVNDRKIEKANVFISLHKNGSNSPSTKGAEVYYSIKREEDLEHSNEISKIIASSLNTNNRKAKVKISSRNNDYFGVIRRAEAIGIEHIFLIETEFITNRKMEEILLDENTMYNYLKKIGDYIEKNILGKKIKNFHLILNGKEVEIKNVLSGDKIYVCPEDLLEKIDCKLKYDKENNKVIINK